MRRNNMKLSKQQIEAIASKIKKNITDPINQHNNAIRSSTEYINFENTDKDCIAINNICEKYGENYYSKQIVSKIKDKHFNDIFIKLPVFGRDNIDLINDIVLGTIEYDNLDELINNLSKKYANA